MARLTPLPELNDEDLQEIYNWVDDQPISRPKRNISRDFSDALPLAEILQRYYPKLVELHNYPAQLSVKQKTVNWTMFNSSLYIERVLNKIGIFLSPETLSDLATSAQGVIERVLKVTVDKLEELARNKVRPSPRGSPGKLNGGANPKKSGKIDELRQTVQELRDRVQELQQISGDMDERIRVLSEAVQENGL